MSSGRIESMSKAAERLTKEALDLDPKERVELAYTLLRSVDGEPEGDDGEVAAAWHREISRRIADFNSGKVLPVPWDDAVAQLQETVKQARRR